MSNTDEPIPPSPGAETSAAPASLALILARVGAIALAISIVAYLVWDAQRTAGKDAAPVVPAADVGGGEAGAGVTGAGRRSEVLMPSSKFAPVDFFAPGSNSGTPDTGSATGGPQILLSGSKSALLPSSKSGAPVTSEASDTMKKILNELQRELEKNKQNEQKKPGTTKANKD